MVNSTVHRTFIIFMSSFTKSMMILVHLISLSN